MANNVPVKKNVLIWAGWYPENSNDYSGVFVKKHIEIISQIANVYVFSIKHKKNLLWFQRVITQEHFGKVIYYFIPSFFPLKHIGYFLIPFIEGYRVKKQLGRIDIFHLHVSYPFVIFTLLLRCLGIRKWVLTEHWSGYTTFDNSFSKLPRIMQFAIKTGLKKMHKVSVVSEFLKTELANRFPFLKSRMIITNNVILSKNITHSQKKHNFYFLTISNLIDNPKNISFLLSVFAEVIKEQQNIQLDIYGDGKDKDKLIEQAQQLGLLNRYVFFKGRVDNATISEVYQQYHAFILLSKFETFSIVTAEAIGHGLPVIVTKCGGPEEFVTDGENGYLVEINHLEATKKAIHKLIENYHLFDPIKIQQSIQTKYSIDKITEQFKELYD